MSKASDLFLRSVAFGCAGQYRAAFALSSLTGERMRTPWTSVVGVFQSNVSRKRDGGVRISIVVAGSLLYEV
jgi:hypothetical protein